MKDNLFWFSDQNQIKTKQNALPRNNIKKSQANNDTTYTQYIFISGVERDISDYVFIMLKTRDLMTDQNEKYSLAQIKDQITL